MENAPEKATRGGAGRGQGRKAADGAAGVVRTVVYLTPEQQVRFKDLGGNVWLRAQIGSAGRAPQAPAFQSKTIAVDSSGTKFIETSAGRIFIPEVVPCSHILPDPNDPDRPY